MPRLDAAARAAAPGDFVTLSDGVTHYQIGGGSADRATPVVLVHGFSVPFFVWDPTFAGLTAAGLPVLRYDLFGRGYSDRPRARYDIDLYDRQLVQLIRTLGLPEPVDFVGLSMGGAIAVGFADRHPALVRRLVLLDPAGLPMPGTTGPGILKVPVLGEIVMATVGKRLMVGGLTGDFHDPAQLPELSRKYRAQMRYPGFLRALLSTIRHGPLQTMADAYERVGRDTRPVLLVWGTEDKTVPFELSETARATLPTAVFHAIHGAGHVPHLEQPDRINRLLIDFLTS